MESQTMSMTFGKGKRYELIIPHVVYTEMASGKKRPVERPAGTRMRCDVIDDRGDGYHFDGECYCHIGDRDALERGDVIELTQQQHQATGVQ